MSWNNGVNVKSMKALSSFANMQYRVVELATSENNACDYAAAGGGYGIILNEPLANEAASVATEGEVQAKAGAAVAIGDYVTVAASAAGGPGWLTKVVSGTAAVAGQRIMGRALSAAASGSIFTLDLEVRPVIGVSSAGLLTI